ncbi:class I SAM-dependent methyltransferase [Flavitalea flava]
MANPLHELDPTGRFSNRAGNYEKYRPSYPPEIIPFLENTIGLRKGQQIADIGSGTGIFTEMLLLKGYSVTGVEPNMSMRQTAEEHLGGYERFFSLDGRAEKTGLADHHIDLITVAQAFHWMDPRETKEEFLRILKPGGHIVLIWYERLTHTAFLKAYEEFFLSFATDYKGPGRANEQVITSFFYPYAMGTQVYSTIRLLDFEGLKGLVLSSSFIPQENDPRYADMIERLEELYATHKENELVKMEYETKLYFTQ